MSVDYRDKSLAFFQFNDHQMFGSRELINGLQFNKGRYLDDIDGNATQPNLNGSKDKSEIIWKNPLCHPRDDQPVKPCLMLPKEEGSDEKIQVRKAKSVHFADSCGLALTSVATLFDNEEELFAFKNFSRSRGLFERKSFPLLKKSKSVEKKKSKLQNFVQPVTLPNFQQQICDNKVRLENVVLREYSIFGTICVANLDFNKNVFVRYTFDSWQSSKDATGVYLSGTSTGKTDTFSFEIPISGDGDGLNVELCVCFETRDCSFWDNNNGQNYKILFYPSRQSNHINDGTDGFILAPKNGIHC